MTIGHNNGPMAEGWIARHRTVRNHPLVGHGLRVNPADPARSFCASKGEAWEDMIMTCNYADGRIRNGGHWMELRRGELVGAVSYLAQRWNWTPKVVRKFLDDLENDGMIAMKKPGVQLGTQKGKQSTVISLCNYDVYQSIPKEEGQAKGQDEGTQGASKGQAEGNKNNKETIKQTTTIIGASDLSQLQDQLLDACNGALDNPANCSGLLNLSIPQMWINEGADLQLDILPTLRAVGLKAHGKRINTWNYFTRAVAESKALRAAGLPAVDVSAQKRAASTSMAAKIKAYNERQNNKSEG